MARNGLIGRAIDRLEEFTGLTIVDHEHLRITEAVSREAMVLAQELDEIGYTAMDFVSGRPNEPSPVARRRWAQQARVVWSADPMAGAAVELVNEFSLGRGVARPRAKDDEVQEIIDEFWDDPQNQRVITGWPALVKFGTSLTLQANVWFLIFDDGDDGKVRYSYLIHDTVESAYTDPQNRQRVLFWLARLVEQEWDFGTKRMKPVTGNPKLLYYENWGAIEEALVERGATPDDAQKYMVALRKKVAGVEPDVDQPQEWFGGDTDGVIKNALGTGLDLPAPQEWGEGKVYHVAENQDMEMIFGTPRMRRTIRWMTAYNDFMKARVDMMLAAASFIAQKTVKGTPVAMEKLAARASRATSDLRSVAEGVIAPGTAASMSPQRAGISAMTDSVKFEPMNLNSGAGNAETDGQMLRGQVSAGERFPQHYLGDVGSANLATATSMELPSLKHIEARMEVVESLLRFGIDRSIDRAVEVGRLDPNQTGDEEKPEQLVDRPYTTEEAELLGECNMLWRIGGMDVARPTRVWRRHGQKHEEYEMLTEAATAKEKAVKKRAARRGRRRIDEVEESFDATRALTESHEDKNDDEASTGRDLSYEFGMPSPLRRMMGDVVTAAVQLGTMADPNGTNIELTRVLTTWVFAQAFEIPDAADLVDSIWPKGYVDPALAAAMGQQGGAGGQPPQPSFFSPDATSMPADPGNAYGAPAQGTAPENVQEAAEMDGPAVVTIGRHGHPVVWPGRQPHVGDTRLGMQVAGRGRRASLDDLFERETRATAMGALADLDMGRQNGNGS